MARGGADNDYGAKANQDLIVTRGEASLLKFKNSPDMTDSRVFMDSLTKSTVAVAGGAKRTLRTEDKGQYYSYLTCLCVYEV
ncbi:hypothetical protein Clacol_006388 [Clathrus columnatus]|uniref:Uncharacterized protein n=1 Tax=Clathrus columnatus TaxID=1419009 RepID=A0AAV5AER3_9AGAM|nr:hypothetical protein Clacol_006388 [Clathrus columnatus]